MIGKEDEIDGSRDGSSGNEDNGQVGLHLPNSEEGVDPLDTAFSRIKNKESNGSNQDQAQLFVIGGDS